MYSVACENLKEDEEEALIQHMMISSQLEDFWFLGDKIVGGIFDYRRRMRLAKRPDHNVAFKHIVKILRKLGKYENLRSSLEAVLFEQAPSLCDLTNHFLVNGVEEKIYLTYVYFRRYTWKIVNEDRRKIEFQINGDDEIIVEEDLSFLLCYFLRLSEFMNTIDEYLKQTQFYYLCKSDVKYVNKAVNTIVCNLMGMLRTALALT